MRSPLVLDRDLGRAEHVAGRLEGDTRVADPHFFAEGGGLRLAGKGVAVAGGHDAERLPGRENGAVAGAGMVGMAVGDQRPRDRPVGSIWKSPAVRIEAGRTRARGDPRGA